MEFRKEYIRRLLPVLGIIAALVLILLGHKALKTRAAEADLKEQEAKEELDNERIREERESQIEKIREELTREIYSIVENTVASELSNIDFTSYITEDDLLLIAQRVETELEASGAFEGGSTKLTDDQRSAVEQLIADAISRYAVDANAVISDEMRAGIEELIDERLSDILDDADLGGSATLSDAQKAEIASSIAESVKHDVLAYVTEHIQIIYGDGSDGGTTLVCDKEEHVHSEECYERVLICDNEEEGHEHDDDCYEWSDDPICGKDEHIHDEACYETPSSGGSGTPCVHVHVDYLLTDEDRKEIVAGVIQDADLARLLGNILFDNIEMTMPDIIQEAFFQRITSDFYAKMDDLRTGIEENMERQFAAIREEVAEDSNVRYFNGPDDNGNTKSTLQVKVDGEWRDFIDASSMAVKGFLMGYDEKGQLVYASGFRGFEKTGGDGSVTNNKMYAGCQSLYNTYSSVTADSSPFVMEKVGTKKLSVKGTYQISGHKAYGGGGSITPVARISLINANDYSETYSSYTLISRTISYSDNYAIPETTVLFMLDLPEDTVGKEFILRVYLEDRVPAGTWEYNNVSHSSYYGDISFTVKEIKLL